MKKVLVTAALMVASSSSFAAGGYAGFDIGWAIQDQEDDARELAQYLANASSNTVNYTYDNGTFVGRLYGGWKGDSNLGFELGYFQSGDLSANFRGTYSGSPASVSTDISASGFDMSGLYWVDDNIHLKAGLHQSEIEATVSLAAFGGTGTASASEDGMGWLVGAGYDSEINKDLSWRASWTYYAKLGGESDSDAHVFSVGLNTKF